MLDNLKFIDFSLFKTLANLIVLWVYNKYDKLIPYLDYWWKPEKLRL